MALATDWLPAHEDELRLLMAFSTTDLDGYPGRASCAPQRLRRRGFLPQHGQSLTRNFDVSSSRETAKVGIGAAVPPGSEHPDISSVEELMETLTNARSVAYSRNGPSGIYFASLIQELGIAEPTL